MARGVPRGFRCRVNNRVKRQCVRKRGKVAVVASIKPNRRTIIRLCRIKNNKRRVRALRRRTRVNRRGYVTGAYEMCRKIRR